MFLVSYFKRHVSKVHKRALFGACVFLVAPAFDRFMRPFNLEEVHPILNFLILLHLIPISLIVHDLMKSRKVYVISAIALILLVLGLPVITFGIKHGFDGLLVEFLG